MIFLDGVESSYSISVASIFFTLAQKYVEDIQLHFDEKIAGMKFYIEKNLNELNKNFKREYTNMTSTKDTVIF